MEHKMSYIIYGVYDSTDAAELSAMRIKRTVRGVKVAGISKRVMPDSSEEMTIYAFPVFNSSLGGLGSGYIAPVPYQNYMVESMHDRNFEPARREDVNLRTEAPDLKTAQAVSTIMRSTGGREIRQVER
jgi:hypothetical protein